MSALASRRPWLESSLIAAIFLALGLLGLVYHEMWRDELEIWIIARDSATLGQLFANMSTEGHPALWYLLNFLLSRFTTDPLAMQLLNLAIGTTTALIFFRYAPFGPFQRALFCFGYYLLYEFTVISRSYGLALLLIFAFCVRYSRHRRLDPYGALLLFLLANTTLFGTIIALQIALLVVIRASRAPRVQRPWRAVGAVAALTLVLLGGAVGFTHVWVQARAIGPAHAGAYAPRHDLTWAASCLATVWLGAVPLPDVATPHFWNTNLLQLLPRTVAALLGGALGILLLGLATFDLRRRAADISVVFLLGTATMLAITFFVWYGSVRHHGQIFLWYLVCCWLASPPAEAEAARPGRFADRAQRWVLSGLLVLQLAAGAFVYAGDLARPFSNAKAVGLYLRQPQFADVVLVGSVDYAVQPITAYVDRRFYYPESGREGTFLDWGPSRHIVPPDVVIHDAVGLLAARRRDVVIVFSYRPEGLEPGNVVRIGERARLTCFARFVGAIVADENYYLCRAQSLDRGRTSGVDSP